MRGLAGRVAFVTGAVRPPGIGRATALRLAAEGAELALVDAPAGGLADADSDAVAPGALDALAEEVRALGRRALTIEAGLTDDDAVGAAVERTLATFGRLELCCHLGGGTGPSLGTGPLLEIEPTAWARCLETNLVAPWLVARACAAPMVRQGGGGAIVVLSSWAVRSAPAGYGAFAAARAGLGRLVEVLAVELAGAGIRVNAVAPLGVAPTTAPNPGLAELVARDGDDLDDWIRRTIPLGRLQDPAETAAVIAFLCSDDASFVSGQVLASAGGALR